MENKRNSQYSSDLKHVFISDFPEFKNAFKKLSLDEEFTDMLMDYRICQMELQKLSDLHGVEEMYLQVLSELREEIMNYIINHIKS